MDLKGREVLIADLNFVANYKLISVIKFMMIIFTQPNNFTNPGLKYAA